MSRPGKPKQHEHNWVWIDKPREKVTTGFENRPNGEVWHGFNYNTYFGWNCIRGNKVKHRRMLPPVPSFGFTSFVPLSGATPIGWRDNKQVAYR